MWPRQEPFVLEAAVLATWSLIKLSKSSLFVSLGVIVINWNEEVEHYMFLVAMSSAYL